MIAVQTRGRFLIIFIAGLSLLTGLWAGLARLGWPLPLPQEQFILAHGPLMVVGFLGTLIGLERAVALARAWPYGIPILTALSSLTTMIALPVQLPAMFASLASLFLLMVFIALYRQYPAEHFVVMGVSAIAWLVGNTLWLMGLPLFSIVPWWVGFLVLMIGAERLELSRVRQPPLNVRAKFHVGIALFVIGLCGTLVDFANGLRVSAVGLLAIALWLLRFDLAWHAARQKGLPRFMAHSFSAGPEYDAMLHAIFLGFVFSMIFAHAPIIFPTITGLPLPFRNSFYLHLGLLHASLLLRIAGDLDGSLALQRWGGLLNTLAILVFLANNILAVKKGGDSSARSNQYDTSVSRKQETLPN